MYVPYNPNPCGLSTGDCTVRAISKALNISWDDAHDILSEFSKNMCDLPHKDWVWGAVLRANGFHRVIVPDTTPIGYSAADFAEDNPRGTFVLGFGGHCCTIVNGDIYDSWDSSNEKPIYVWFREEQR